MVSNYSSAVAIGSNRIKKEVISAFLKMFTTSNPFVVAYCLYENYFDYLFQGFRVYFV